MALGSLHYVHDIQSFNQLRQNTQGGRNFAEKRSMEARQYEDVQADSTFTLPSQIAAAAPMTADQRTVAVAAGSHYQVPQTRDDLNSGLSSSLDQSASNMQVAESNMDGPPLYLISVPEGHQERSNNRLMHARGSRMSYHNPPMQGHALSSITDDSGYLANEVSFRQS